MKYPVGIQTFEKIIEGDFVYVDKTDLVYSLVNEGQIYFLSRPRRFGKSLLLSTLRAYFEGKKNLFAGLKIEALEHDWHVHRIFHFDFNGVNFTVPGALNRVLSSILSQWEQEYGIVSDLPLELGLRFGRILQAAAEQTGRGAVVLVDEYDKPLLDVLEKDPELLNQNREILKSFYSVFKQADASLRFVFLTGVTKVLQSSAFGGFNQALDISITNKFEALCGFTEEEVFKYFAKHIREMAVVEGCREEEISQRLKQHYDGYHFSENLTDIYNPFSVLNTLHSQNISDYWTTNGIPLYLVRLINNFHGDINELINKYYLPNEFINYKADTEYPLPMIYQSGYLTIKDYEKESNLFLLGFPNNEVKNSFLAMVTTNYSTSA